MSQLEQINAIVSKPFDSLEDCLAFYRRELPKRTAGYHQDEVGPVMHHDRPGEADKFVAKIFTLGEHTLDMSAGLDWHATPTGDLEWNGGLVRHGYFMLLAAEYERTGDEKYARTIIEHLTHYIDHMPRFDPAGKPYLEYKKSTWRPFEAAGRAAETWPEALGKIIKAPAMTPEIWAKILLSIHEHGDFLAIHHWRTGNHACLEVAALGLLGLFYREFREAEAWRRYAVEFLMNMWPEQFHRDGYTKEMSGGYHWVAMRSFFTFYEVAAKNGFESIFPPLYQERLLLTSRAELLQSKPDYSVPITNDSNTKTNRREQLERINRLLAIPEIAHRLSGGREGREPGPASYFFPYARVGCMRSDWSDDARYLCFDMGRWGDNHMNEDQLNVEVSAYGRKFLVNCGRWRYTTSPDAPWMPWAKYFKRTAAYNSVRVDGYDQVAADADGFLKVYPDYDFAEGIFEAGYGEEATAADEKLLKEKGVGHGKVTRVGGVTHKRQIFFAKPDFWVLRDTVSGAGEHEAEQIWHFYDGELRPLPGGGFLATDFDDANLIIGSFGGGKVEAQVFMGSEDPIRGWHCPYYDQLRPAPELSYRQWGTGQIVFHTLIFPVRGKVTDQPKLEVTKEGYRIEFQGKLWEIIAPELGEWRFKK
jgi:hypothetical protein